MDQLLSFFFTWLANGLRISRARRPPKRPDHAAKSVAPNAPATASIFYYQPRPWAGARRRLHARVSLADIAPQNAREARRTYIHQSSKSPTDHLTPRCGHQCLLAPLKPRPPEIRSGLTPQRSALYKNFLSNQAISS